MSGLAHYFEGAGIATTLIALIREHTERMKSPRGLAVPFELGRPFGAPNEPDFQRRVMKSALDLLQRTDGPILEDFPDDPPGPPADMEGWSCPVNLAPPPADLSEGEQLVADLQAEIGLLRPWYAESVKASGGRKLTGQFDMQPDAIAAFLVAALGDELPASPVAELPLHRALKLSTDELKYFYQQAALARPGAITDVEMGNWFYGETIAGKLYFKLRRHFSENDDPALQLFASNQLVPYHQRFRDEI
ncbi:MAG: hypothetical protein QGH73_15890 [Rhodospirillales bacterium]|nr:hypothetical protein [Rhodospirillaceae bacterium]MDP6644652.1 hypothetical protein [Rhodospirillales bacterium]MDP6843152.1 hypothetical protein [Rhodospirillales bacterium]